jgi:hypothetical protein
MSAIEIGNRVVTLPLAGKPYKITRLSVVAIMRTAEDYVIDQRIRLYERLAQGKTAQERDKMLTQAAAELPSGSALEKMGRTLLGADMPNELAMRLLHAALLPEHPTMTLDEAALIFADAVESETVAVFRAVRGNVSSPAAENSGHSQRSTSGRRKS